MTILEALAAIAKHRTRFAMSEERWTVTAQGFEPSEMNAEQVNALDEIAALAEFITKERQP